MAFYRDLIERLNATAGVESASLVGSPPLSLSIRLARFAARQDAPEQETRMIDTTKVWRGYFQTMGIPLVRGRDFSPTDTETSPAVAVVNETMARTEWPNQDPLGKRFFIGFPEVKPIEVVGVARDGKYRTLGESPRPFVYTTFQQSYEGMATVIVRAAGGASTGISTLRNAIQALDPETTTFGLQTMKDRIGVSLLLPQYVAGLFGAFGLLGAALAIVGLYGVVSYSVSQRTQEMGVRMALGGQRVDVFKLILMQGMKLTAAGLVLGLIIAVVTTRLLAAILYGIGATDPVTFAAVSLLMILVTLAACYIPARRATRIDPMVALRHE
jgi:putative ABC transport system permease protein